ncbi:DUF4003 domain-containing protein [Marinococcus halophilus]|uniref:Uncharacterized protein n=1 Tax=Marinococcus halophilus TaxID=1371 RepID=A0A510Y1L2_MARHA|nr:DUF4003 family protein [Marinococcus halophilus]OZT81258.1 DUF4003 domain-containing protein [Marinococcus halophilus]GEK57200.1 hypothetical protein MHA01_01050 [Marinococcus halophilus]
METKEQLTAMTNDYLHTYEALKKKYPWYHSDARMFMLMASMYSLYQKPFDSHRFDRLQQTIKKKNSWFSPLRSHQRFPIAGMLDCLSEDPENSWPGFKQLYSQLVQGPWGRGTSTYAAALSYYAFYKDDFAAVPAFTAWYQFLQESFPELTSADYYPLHALCIHQFPGNKEQMIEHMNNVHHQLLERDFKKGPQLQYLSFLAALNLESLGGTAYFERFDELLEYWKSDQWHVRPFYYSLLGVLGFTTSFPAIIDDARSIHARLAGQGEFRRFHHFAVHISLQLAVAHHAYTNGGSLPVAVLEAQRAVALQALNSSTSASAAITL